MADYNPRDIEAKWRQYWQEKGLYKVSVDHSRPKYYILDMFPYPSGAGLHVGHPLGYIASDILARYKRLKGFNVLHPMGYDSFGLPAEQYAIETGQHPALTTQANINTYRSQLEKIGFSYDWDREVRTSDPAYYRWTQWIFGELFESWYDRQADKARPISELTALFAQQGNSSIDAVCDEDTPAFSAKDWLSWTDLQRSDMLLRYRLTYLAEVYVNWCPALGTVLANDEVKDGFSERGGHPVERKQMRQWMMRITAYADRLLHHLDQLHWPEAVKEIQRNWIGKSFGCELDFAVEGQALVLTAFTTRPDTIFGVTYLVLAPEHEAVTSLTTATQRQEVESYVEKAKNRSERDRMADVKTVSGAFTGSYVTNPLTGTQVPVWVADYVLAGYGTGVVMGVPSSDDRDHRFAKHFGLPIVCVIEGTETAENPTERKHGKLINSGFLNGMDTDKAIHAAIARAVELGVGKAKVNYKLRDAVFGRQRYWGEPVPVYFQNGIPKLLPDDALPLVLPEIDQYRPTATGEPPLARAAQHWKYQGFDYEWSTMPGWAGSSWYFLRYMDPANGQAFASREATDYWGEVDFYLGGSEHATGHLLYARFWNMFLYDRGFIGHEEPFRRLVNQGMIQGRSSIAYKLKDENTFVSHGLRTQYEVIELHVDVNIVENDVLDIEAFRRWRPEYADAQFVTENGKYLCGSVVEKMSKRWYNVVNPDDVIARYGADTFRLYEMFLGPIEQSKPWSTESIDGVARFLRKFWRLFYDEKGWIVTEEPATPEALKVLHKTLRKLEEDIERLSFNTCVSTFMICTNELTALGNASRRQVLEPLLVALSPFAPHIAEELWQTMGHQDSILTVRFPQWDPALVQDDSYECAIQVNGKVRTTMQFGMDMSAEDIQAQVLASEVVQKWLEGKAPKKVIVVPKKIVNVVI